MNHGTNFHPIIGSGVRASVQMLFMMASAQHRTPSAWAWITFTSAIGINNDVRLTHDVFIPVPYFVDWYFGQRD